MRARCVELLEEALGQPIHGISGVTGDGLRELGELMWTAVQEVRELEPAPEAADQAVRIDLGSAFEDPDEDLARGGVRFDDQPADVDDTEHSGDFDEFDDEEKEA
jgi:hypothetical protein